MRLAFESWQRWSDRASRPTCRNPGIYALAFSDADLTDAAFTVLEGIVYFGMTNGTLEDRLDNFHKTVTLSKCQHGGADRFLFKHRVFSDVVERLYLAQWPFDVFSAATAADKLRLKGRVLQAEYECFAAYVEKFEQLPEFNRSSSQKYTAKVKNF
ncbi:MAG: hypothetical protein K2Y40_06425 [Reyranella sp.]|nr:hypothetical protein [Reyranella sp.]